MSQKSPSPFLQKARKRARKKLAVKAGPSQRWFVYMIETEDGYLYTGISKDVQRRFIQHSKGKGSKFLRVHEPERVRFIEKQPSVSKAMRREREIKKLSRPQKLGLCLLHEANFAKGEQLSGFT